MNASLWILILIFSNNTIFSYTYQSLVRCETAGRYTLSLPLIKRAVRPITFYCIPGGFDNGAAN